MKNTNFCAKANMKRDVNRVEPARRVLLKAEAVLLAVLVLFLYCMRKARQRRCDSDESAAICGAANIGTRSAAGRIAETPHAAQPE